MSGEGSISDIRQQEIRRTWGLDPAPRPITDIRAIAERLGLAPGVSVCGSRFNGAGARGAWQVLATVRGDDGRECQVALTPERARALAAELTDLADVLEGKRW